MSENTKKDGGNAFPVSSTREDFAGMTLRDWMAGKALPGVITAIMAEAGHNWTAADFAREAYEIADAMIAARGAA